MANCHGPGRASPPKDRGTRAAQPRPAVGGGLRRRVALFGATTAAVVVGAGALLWPSASGGPADRSVEITMGGFSPPRISTAAGRAFRLELVNPDSSMHTDGGGWHQLAIPALRVDARVGPRSRSVVEIPAAEPGEYPFYCDVCCGGKENPSMQGVLRVV